MDDAIDLPSSFIPSFARGMEILVVDHDRTSLASTASMLEQYTFKVTTTESSSVALSLIQEHKDKFKLVMASYDMQDMDCFSFLQKVYRKDIPVITMSSRIIKDAVKALAAGASFCLDKPLSINDVKYVWQHAYWKRKGLGVDRKASKAPCSGTRREPSAAAGFELDFTSHEIIAADDNGHHQPRDNRGKGKELVVEGEGLHVFDQQQKTSDAQHKIARGERSKRAATGNDLDGTSHETVAADSHRVDKGKGKKVKVEVEGLGVSDQLQKMSDAQRKIAQGKRSKRAAIGNDLDCASHENVAPDGPDVDKGKGKEVEVEGLRVSDQQQKISKSHGKRKQTIEDLEALDGSGQQYMMVDAKNAQRSKRVRRVDTGNELHGIGHENIASGDHGREDKGKGKEVGIEAEVLRVSDYQQQEMTTDTLCKGKQIVEESSLEWDDQSMNNDAYMSLILNTATQGKSKQIVEEALHGGQKDQHMMIDVQRKGNQIEEELAPVDEDCTKESKNVGFASLVMIENLNEVNKEGGSNGKGDQINMEQEELDTNKTNLQKGKEAIIVEATEAEQEPATRDEEEMERERIAAHAEEKGKEILEMADNDEKDQQKNKNSNKVLPGKKPRLIWTPQLHQKFKAALQVLGDDKARPKSIHAMMYEPNLTKRQIASHLQKYKARLQHNCENSKHSRPSMSYFNARYPYSYLANPEITKVLRKSREIAGQLTREMSNRHAYRFSRTPSFPAPDFSTPYGRLSNNEVPLTSAMARRRLNLLSAQFTIGHPLITVKLATRAEVNATLNPSPGNVANMDKFPRESKDGNWDSRVVAISDPTSANVSNADKYLTNFGHGDIQADVLKLCNTPASVSLSNAPEMPISFSDGNQKSNAGASTNPPSDLVHKTTPYSMKSNGVNQKLDASAISNPTRGNASGIGSVLIDSIDEKEELDFVDNVLNLDEFLMDCSDDKQMAEAMEIWDPALGNLPNAEVSANCNDGVQVPKAMRSANATPDNVLCANKSSAYSTDGKQELHIMTKSNPTAGYAHNSSNFRMKPATGNQELDTRAVSFPPACLSNPNQPQSEFADLWWLLEDASVDIQGTDAELNPGDVDRYCKSLRNVLDGSNWERSSS